MTPTDLVIANVAFALAIPIALIAMIVVLGSMRLVEEALRWLWKKIRSA